jgi:2-polyprenyl-6-methoxyphenol hydroxylase-like FAD-dependent oxidoreductase
MFELQTVTQSAPLRLISAKPERPEWVPNARVTLLGDAIHAMVPAGGSGANAALADAASLLRMIVEKGVGEDLASSYVDEMWESVVPLIERSNEAGRKLLGFRGFEHAKEVEF